MEYQEIQEAELEALKAIYMDDYADVESRTVWKSVNAVHEFTLRIYPEDTSLKSDIQAILHFKLPQTYPKLPPNIGIERAQGISKVQLSHLQALLDKTARSMLGSEMIYELANKASSYLTDNNAVIGNDASMSLGDDRRRREVEIEASKAAEIDSKLKVQQAEDESNALTAALTEIERLRFELSTSNERNNSSRVQAGLSDGALFAGLVEEFDPPLQISSTTTASRVIIGPITYQTILGPIHSGIAIISAQHGMRSDISIMRIDVSGPYYATITGTRKLEAIDTDLNRCMAIKHDCNVQIFGWRRAPLAGQDGWRYFIVTEALNGTLTSELLASVNGVSSDIIVQAGSRIADLLQIYHSQDLVHRSVTVDRMLLYSGSDDNVKLLGGIWFGHLLDLNRSDAFIRSITRASNDSWKAPGLRADPLSCSASYDVWDLGVLMLRCSLGAEYYSGLDLTSALNTVNNSHLRNLLRGIFQNRVTTIEGVQHQMAAEQNSSKSATIGMPSTTYADAASREKPAGLFYQPNAPETASRYRSEFEEVESLGQGGFGQVVKARNKLDSNFYAIKKVRLPRNPALAAKTIREVQIWGRLSHPNIVRYHTCWVESTITDIHEDSEGTDPLSSDALNAKSKSGNSSAAESDVLDGESDKSSAVMNSLNAAAIDFSLGFSERDLAARLQRSRIHSNLNIHFGNEDDPSTEPSRAVSRSDSPKVSLLADARSENPLIAQRTTLYIQMEYIDGQTLKERIEYGLSNDEFWRIMRQILNAMRYYNSFDIIHRDLKPSNILMDASLNVHIADFGLAVEQHSNTQDVNFGARKVEIHSELTSGIGTSLYIAPEVLSGQRPPLDQGGHRYDDKVDIYALGVIAFEMSWHMSTSMERIETLRALRATHPIFPHAWGKRVPEYGKRRQLIEWCLQHSPQKRADAAELLNSHLMPQTLPDEALSTALALIVQPGSPHVHTLIAALYQARVMEQSTKQGPQIRSRDSGIANNPYEALVKTYLANAFACRGAVEVAPPIVFAPAATSTNSKAKPLLLIDQQGLPLQIQQDLLYPFLNFSHENEALTRLKRWSIGPVFSVFEGRTSPDIAIEAAFDILSTASTLASEAECIQLAYTALSDLLGSEAFELNIAHTALRDKLTSTLHYNCRLRAQSILNDYVLGLSSWTEVAVDLSEAGLSRAQIAQLAAIDLCTDLTTLTQRLEEQTPSLTLDQSAVEQLRNLASICTAIGIAKPIQICPLLAFHTAAGVSPNGVVFSARSQLRRSREIYVTGGRFDSALHDMSKISLRRHERHLVHLEFSVSKLAQHTALLGDASKRSIGLPRRCDVYIVSFTAGLVEARLSIARALWASGISTDLMYDDEFARMSPERLVATAAKEGILAIVYVKTDINTADLTSQVRVRDIATSTETDVFLSQLSQAISSLLNPDYRDGARLSSSRQDDAPGISSLLDPQLSMPADVMKRMKQKQKSVILAKAVDAAEASWRTMRGIPLFAVDLEGEAFRLASSSMEWTTTRDNVVFRRLLDAVQPGARSYVQALRVDIAKYRSKHDSKLILMYSLRDGSVRLVSLPDT